MKRLCCLILTAFLAVSMMPQTAQAKLNKRDGVCYFEGHKETYYNLPMDRVLERADRNFGSHHKRWIRGDGCKMYGPYIIAAGAVDRYGEIVRTSLGEAIILDSGAFAINNPEQLDLAVNW